MSESKDNKKSSKPVKPKIVGEEDENPLWYKIAMFGFMILGLIWISARFPLGSSTPINLSNWNILIGFGIAMIGFSMTTRWK
ncbi:MAG: cell division protein CrgA [Actinobacteria bacterium]|nr:cell division protein CrgA [Actinomycetota bacterium]